MKRFITLLIISALISTGCALRERQPTSAKPPLLEPPATTAIKEGKEDPTGSEEEVQLVVKLVVPEGYTLARIGMALKDLGVCTPQEFIQATQEIDYSDFPLIAQQQPDPNRCFNLEGYLFPATYEIYAQEPPESIIRRMLAQTESRISPDLQASISATGYTVNEILTIASIIEKEAYERNDSPVPQEMPKISSVLHNRLRDGTPLQCDVTINYVEGALKPFIDGDINRYNDYYNTYKAPALPPGPICNPSMDAILAAITPEDTNYMFFLTDDDKNFYYSETWEEHEILVAKYL